MTGAAADTDLDPPTIPAPVHPPSPVLGIGVETDEPSDLLRRITDFARSGGKRRVMYVNAHVLNRSTENSALRHALEGADLVYCDGYGVRLAARVLGLRVPIRMTGADWVWGLAPLCEQKELSLYLLGSEPGTAEHAADALRRWYPRLKIVGHHHGYFEPGSQHNERVLEDIARRSPDILLLGMGTPKQEVWAADELERIDARVIWGVGSLFDYVSQEIPRAPHWLADNGLEWIFRLGLEPRRMWRRYLIGNPRFIGRIAREASAGRAREPRPGR
ncbi:MAG: WecB/TagA/CpsF family glycosyltransferase [Solirubrobacterales bacterium]